MNDNFISRYGVQPADVIVVPKSEFRVVEHYAVYAGVNIYEPRQDLFLENKINYGVRIIDYNGFVAENPEFLRIRRFVGNEYERNLAMQRAWSLVGQKYNLLTFNCEHFANYVQNYEVKSNQVRAGLVLTGLALLLAAGTSSKQRRSY